MCFEELLSTNERLNSYSIGTFEILLYFFVTILHSAIALILAANSSQNVGGIWFSHWLERSEYIDGFKMDLSDVEWALFRMSIFQSISMLVIHSVSFNFILRLPIYQVTRSIVLCSMWLIMQAYFSSLKCILVIFVGAILLLTLTFYTRRRFFAWAISLLFIAKIVGMVSFSTQPANYYREFNLYLYSAIKVINISAYLCRNPLKQIDREMALQYLEYMLYPPYSISLIVLFEDFQKQRNRVLTAIKENNSYTCCNRITRELLFRSLRLLFAFLLLDALLHILRVNAFFNAPFTMLRHMNNYEVFSIAYAAGQLFHLKYVVIFGLPSLFASIDGMEPPAGPVCISRVSKYSQMWRQFDRGLYAFLKEQVYIPLMDCVHWPKKAPPSVRRLAAVLCVFTFVLLWHGVTPNYFWWVALSAFEFFVERAAKDWIWPSEFFQICVRRKLSPANFVRLKALAMLFTVIPGIFGVFFFLSRTGAGSHIFESILFAGLCDIFTLNVHFMNPGFILLHLFAVGYCFNHVSLYLEERHNICSVLKAKNKDN